MPVKRYKPEQIVTLLRQIEVGIANGKPTPQACKEAEIVALGDVRHALWLKQPPLMDYLGPTLIFQLCGNPSFLSHRGIAPFFPWRQRSPSCCIEVG